MMKMVEIGGIDHLPATAFDGEEFKLLFTWFVLSFDGRQSSENRLV